MARALLWLEEAGPLRPEVAEEGYLLRGLQPEAFGRSVHGLSARRYKAYLELLLSRRPSETIRLLLGELGSLPSSAIGDTVEALCRHGAEADCRDALGRLIEKRPAPINVLNWLADHLEPAARWELATPSQAAYEILAALEMEAAGTRSRERSQLAGHFERPGWLRLVLSAMEPAQRPVFLQRVRSSSAFSTVDRRSVLARIIKLYPALEAELASTDPEERGPARQRLYSSRRSIAERQARLAKLVQVDLPANSREIAVARSYGDLRENHEYKAAKEMQGILLRRQTELEEQLAAVQPTDFSGVDTGRVGMGTGVVLLRPDGRRETYYVLGEWDRDETLGIISCRSKLAQCLDGTQAGSEVEIPGAGATVTGKVVEITGLPPEIRAWIDAMPPAP
jgi:transcription elongation GreA/GreB family factor